MRSPDGRPRMRAEVRECPVPHSAALHAGYKNTTEMILREDIRASIAGDPELWGDFEALCDFGGRLSGTDGERQALAFLRKRGAQASGVSCRALPVPYHGWRARDARLVFGDGSTAPCHPLVRTVATPAAGI